MREAESSRSAARLRAVSDAATQRRAAPVAGPASSWTCVSHASSTPAAASGSARRHASSTPQASRRSSIASSASAASMLSSSSLSSRARERLALELDEPLGVGALDAGLDELAQRGADHVERVGEVGGGALDRRGRVVELVGEPRGHGAQRLQALAVLLGAGQPRHDRLHLLHHAVVHRRVGERQAAEVVGRDERDLARDGRRHPHAERSAGEDGDGADPRRADLAPDRLGAAVVDDHGLRLALEQALEALDLGALLGQQLAGLVAAALGHRRPLREPIVVEVVEEVDGAQVGDGDGGGRAHACARYSWMSETAIEPSPTALATRLIERARTSPATKTPGHAGLQRVGVAAERPARRPDVGAGEDEAALVARDDALQPIGPRRRADEDEDGVDLLGRLGAVGPRACAARSRDRPRPRPRPPASRCGPRRSSSAGDLLDEVVRHRLGQRVGAHEHDHAARRLAR